MCRVADLAAIFKAYDVRGLVPEQLDESTARQIGAAFVTEVLEDPTDSAVVIGHDMRASSPGLAAAFSAGVRAAGADAVMIGPAATDELYFASGSMGLPGAMITASHNPAAYNGIKLCRSGAVALARETGLDAIRVRVGTGSPLRPAEGRRGGCEERDVLPAYARHLHELVSVRGRRLTVVVDAGNGMAGHTVPSVFAPLDVELFALYFEPDGTFPNHPANPLDPATLVDLQAAVVRHDADLGLAFDGDADRCFVVDERGQVVRPSALTALIAVRSLAKEPGARIVYNLISSRAVRETIDAHGGVAVRTRVGHSLIKQTMARVDAVFGGEHSGHFYFRDFWYADSGMLAALHLLSAVAASPQPVSALLAEFDPYAASGEINQAVADLDELMSRVECAFTGRDDVVTDHLDGLTVTGSDWWFNIRSSNTEPLLRLNVEAETEQAMIDTRDAVLSLMRRGS